MCGIAEVLHHLGYQVSGSDLLASSVTQRLEKLGIEVFIGHNATQVEKAEMVVVSSAVQTDNPEVVYARSHQIPVMPRAQMLAELMRLRTGIAVAGTHGKTTTTSLIASIFAMANLDPTFVIGGCLKHMDSNASLGRSDYFIAEADESDASFLHLHPQLAVVTNIDADHMATYQHDMLRLEQAFVDFLQLLPFDGYAVLCGDDDNIQRILPTLTRRYVTYGFTSDCHFCVSNFEQVGRTSYFQVTWDDAKHAGFSLPLFGRHNVLNAAAAIAMALMCQIELATIQKALASFHGIARRSEWRGDFAGHPLFDDYGHHPCEINATLQGLRAAYPGQRLFWFYQPHRYTRTAQLFEDLVNELAQVDQLVLFDIYPAGEPAIAGIDSEHLAQAITAKCGHVVLVSNFDEALQYLLNILQLGDVIVTQGAGSIAKLPEKIERKLLHE